MHDKNVFMFNLEQQMRFTVIMLVNDSSISYGNAESCSMLAFLKDVEDLKLKFNVSPTLPCKLNLFAFVEQTNNHGLCEKGNRSID